MSGFISPNLYNLFECDISVHPKLNLWSGCVTLLEDGSISADRLVQDGLTFRRLSLLTLHCDLLRLTQAHTLTFTQEPVCCVLHV